MKNYLSALIASYLVEVFIIENGTNASSFSFISFKFNNSLKKKNHPFQFMIPSLPKTA
jgi:hypothetical protein